MNEEYLWDKSGEPDPQIQKLEEILGTLRYQPKPLELPEVIRPVSSNRRRYISWVAVAATLLLALLSGMIWFRSQSKPVPQNRIAEAPPTPVAPVSPKPEVVAPENKTVKLANSNAPAPRHRREFVAVNPKRRTVEPVPSKEALLAKEQLMSALRLASEKLNLAHRKTQGPTPNQIRNQHKLG